MNSIHLVGNVGQNPSLRETSGGTPVANVTLATNNVYKDRDGNRQQTTEWHRLVVWGEGAKNFAEIVRSGDKIAVRGRLEYKLREIAGEKVKDAVVRVEEWHQLTARKARADEEAGPDATVTDDAEDLDGLQGKDEIPLGAGEPGTPLGEGQQESAVLGDEARPAAKDLEPAEGTDVASGEEIPSETAPAEVPAESAPADETSSEAAPEENGTTATRPRRRRR